jgi:hypothetical protein
MIIESIELLEDDFFTNSFNPPYLLENRFYTGLTPYTGLGYFYPFIPTNNQSNLGTPASFITSSLYINNFYSDFFNVAQVSKMSSATYSID